MAESAGQVCQCQDRGSVTYRLTRSELSVKTGEVEPVARLKGERLKLGDRASGEQLRTQKCARD